MPARPTASPAARGRTSGKPAKRPQAAEPRLSRLRRPAALPVADWQTALRRQFGREQNFELHNLGREPVFSEFSVHNPASGTRWRVAIRGAGLGQNFCSCPDFATNDLGTCKHIEFTLARLESRRGGKAALRRGFQPAYSEIWLDYAGARHVRFRAGSGCPPAVLAQAQSLFDPAAGWALPWSRLDDLPPLLQAARDADHELRCYDDVWQFVAQIRDGERRQAALAAAYPKGAADKGLDKLLKVRLYPYQAEGALFAARAGRALIGDEMGLGKTIQAIAAAELFARHFGVSRVLVVCPTSLKHQWKKEFERFTSREAQVVHGLRAARERQYHDEVFCRITHYETLAKDGDLIDAWAPDLVIADEAQRIKNWNTIAARALKRIASPYAVVLTGTPLENKLEELISIVQFVDRHRLGPTWRLLDRHQQRDEAGRVIGYRALDHIGQTLAPVMLRRRKAEVLAQLPERVDQRIFVPLTPEQRAHHDDAGEIVTRIVARWRKTGYLSDSDQKRLQCALQIMRMACNSTFLVDHETDHGHKVDELMAVLDELFEDPAAKAVVFSQWLGTHELIARRLGQGAGRRNWGHVLFSGEVPGDRRGALVERFHQDPACRLFLATDAGGVGLNLQHAAAVVINMDLPWNPAVLEQRIGRVHRMGQSRGVQVINFVGQGSIEEGMLSVLTFKKSLFAGVLDGGAGEVFLGGTRLSQFMRSVGEVTASMGEAEAASTETAEGSAGASTELADAEAAAAPLTAGTAAAAAAAEAIAPWAGEAAPPLALQAAAPAAAEAAAAEAMTGPPAPAQAASAAHDPWPALLQAGAALLQGLALSGGAPRIEHDPATGAPNLRLPLPDPEVLHGLARALEPWLRR
jgi:superfamily II DNA or RNA helicase